MHRALPLTQNERAGNRNDNQNKMLIQHTSYRRTETKMRAVYLLAKAVTRMAMLEGWLGWW